MKKQELNKDKIKLSKKNKKILFVLLAILVLGFVIRFGIDYFDKKEEVVDNSIPVSCMTVKESQFEKYIEIFGSAKAEKESIIVPKTPALVEKVNVKPGQRVNKGDILFIMNTEDVDSQLKQSQAAYEIAISNADNVQGAGNEQQLQQLKTALDSAKINYDDAKVNFDRVKSLYDSGGASKKEIEQLENSLDIAKMQYETSKKNYELYVNEIQSTNSSVASSQLKQAEAGYDASRKLYEDMIVRSDIAGEVGISNVEVGKIAGSGQSVAMTVVDYDKIILDLDITEENITKITDSSRCVIAFDVLPGREFEGNVEGRSSSVDPLNGLYQLKIGILNTDKAIKPGMYASVKIFDKSVKNAVVLPIDTIIKDGEENYVFTLNKDNTVSKKVITLSENNGEVVIVSSGLSIGEQVISKGQDYLDDKDSVRVITE